MTIKTGLLSALVVFTASAFELSTATVQPLDVKTTYVTEGVVEAEQSTVVAAQVAAKVVAVAVQVGDTVLPEQYLLRLDDEIAQQQLKLYQAQLKAAQAQWVITEKTLQRQRQLVQQGFIGQAALDAAVTDYQTAQAQLEVLQAQIQSRHREQEFFTLRAPYRGIISQVHTEVGAMATPGMPLLSLYQPERLRVLASLPQSKLADLSLQRVQIELPTLATATRWLTPTAMVVLPTADNRSLTQQIRLTLPTASQAIIPGLFARVHVHEAATTFKPLVIPKRAVLRRGELVAVYVVLPPYQAQLRQIRLGKAYGDQVEVLSGLSVGERIALDPDAAAHVGIH